MSALSRRIHIRRCRFPGGMAGAPLCHPLSELQGRSAIYLPEHPAEGWGIRKTAGIGDVRDSPPGIGEQAAGFLQPQILQILLNAFSAAV